MQIVAYGAQDIYLTGNPQVTFFKAVYRRHTNFATESIIQTFNGDTGFGRTASCILSRNGDLINKLTLEAVLPPTNDGAWVHDVGNYLIDHVDLEIGGQLMDRHYGDWLEIWSQLTIPAEQVLGYRDMIGQGQITANGAYSGLQVVGNHPATTLYIPLQFWFCRNIGLALPLIALQYHEVKLNIKFADLANVLVTGVTTEELKCSLYADYVYLDTDERRRFAQVSHEYLIEQVQFNGEESYTAQPGNYQLTLNHPVKELIWTCVDRSNVAVAPPDVWSADNFTIPPQPFYINGTGTETGNSISVDGAGNIYVLINVDTGSTIFGYTAPRNSTVIAKYDNNYNQLWTRWFVPQQIISLNNTYIKVENDNIYVLGRTNAPSAIDLITTPGGAVASTYSIPAGVTSGSGDLYIFKLSAAGTMQWFNWIVSTSNDYTNQDGYELFGLKFNDIYIANTTFNATMVRLRADGTEINAGNRDVTTGASAMYKLNKVDGSLTWKITVTKGYIQNLCIDNNGDIFTSGYSNVLAGQQTITFVDNTNIIINRTNARWVMKIATDGSTQRWFRFINGPTLTEWSSVDSNGNIFCSGTSTTQLSTQDLNGNTLSTLEKPAGSQDGFVLRFSTDGTANMIRWLGNTGVGYIDFDNNNNVLLSVGGLTSVYTNTDILYQSAGASTGLVMLYADGTFAYAKKINGIPTVGYPIHVNGTSVYLYVTNNANTAGVISNSYGANETYNNVNSATRGTYIYAFTYTIPQERLAPIADIYSVATVIGDQFQPADNFAPVINAVNPVATAILQINGNDRFANRVGDYFSLVQPYRHHTCIPKSRGINVYSFALKPEEHQPSGTCNFSRIDNCKLNLTYRPGVEGGSMRLYAVNYNVLRVMSGMGGLAYSN